MRLYPDPVGTAFRETAARLNGVGADQILVGNGSDDVLTILTRAFAGAGDAVVYPTPSYVLYRTLAELQNARAVEVPFDQKWGLDPDQWVSCEPRLAFLANPNSPSGTVLAPEEVGKLASRLPCPLVVDEAYGDFSETNCMGLVDQHENVIVTRSLSKGYGLAGLRVGYLVARKEIVEGLNKVKDSYNCDRLSLVGGQAALEDQGYLSQTRGQILRTRARLTEAVTGMGYRVPRSAANFVWCEGGPPSKSVYDGLRERKILVRLMRYEGRGEGLRITVGTDEEIDVLIVALGEVVNGMTG